MTNDSRAAEADPADALALLRRVVEGALDTLPLPDEPAELYEPVRYALAAGGKRIRPILTLLAAEACGGSVEDALPAALAVEVFHNFTLVHDDIMDHAAERRGRPTVHRVWNESTAILAGDLMMGLSYELLARTPTDDLATLVRVFHRMVARVCEGQALDEAFEQRETVTTDDYFRMISGKTGALIECALELGGRVANADADTLHALTTAGHALGRAFQVQDDLLDLTAEKAALGKTIGGDLIEGKKTILLLLAMDRAETDDDRAFFASVADGGLDPALVPEARQRMDRLGVLDAVAEDVNVHCRQGVTALQFLPESPARAALLGLARSLASRAS